MTLITREQTLDALRKAVETRGGDYIYGNGYPGSSMCHYRWTREDVQFGLAPEGEKPDQPACIAGMALDTLGLLHKVVANWQAPNNYRTSVDDLQLEGDMEPAAIAALSAAQEKQDVGGVWFDAFNAAKAAP